MTQTVRWWVVGLLVVGALLTLWYVSFRRWPGLAWLLPAPPQPMRVFVSKYSVPGPQGSRMALADPRPVAGQISGREVPAAYPGEPLVLEATAYCRDVRAFGLVDGQPLRADAWKLQPQPASPVSDRWGWTGQVTVLNGTVLNDKGPDGKGSNDTGPSVQPGKHRVTLFFWPGAGCRNLPGVVRSEYVVLPLRIANSEFRVNQLDSEWLRGELLVEVQQAGDYDLCLGFQAASDSRQILPVFLRLKLAVGPQTLNINSRPVRVGVNGAEPLRPLVLREVRLRPVSRSPQEQLTWLDVTVPVRGQPLRSRSLQGRSLQGQP